MQVLNNIIKSYKGMPMWVQLWIGLLLAPANFACVFFITSEVGLATAIAGAGVLVFNGFLLFMNQGFSKVLAIPHLIFWGPLQYYLGVQIFGGALEGALLYYAWIVFIFNAISLAFDVVDTYEWIKGNRGISGLPEQKVWL